MFFNGWVGTHRSNHLTSLKNRKFKRDIHGLKVAILDSQVTNRSVLNLSLSILIAGLLIWYAFWANHLGASPYQESILKARFSKLTEENSLLLAEKSSSADLSSLFAFAKRAGLVEQKNVEYIFNEKGLAQAQNTLAR